MDLTELLTIKTTPNDPGQTKYYMNYTAGGKSVVASDHIDTIQLTFTYIRGNNVLSLDAFLITILLDQVVVVPNPPKNKTRVSLKDTNNCGCVYSSSRTNVVCMVFRLDWIIPLF